MPCRGERRNPLPCFLARLTLTNKLSLARLDITEDLKLSSDSEVDWMFYVLKSFAKHNLNPVTLPNEETPKQLPSIAELMCEDIS